MPEGENDYENEKRERWGRVAGARRNAHAFRYTCAERDRAKGAGGLRGGTSPVASGPCDG